MNELRVVQASLIQAEKLAALGQLVAHEINTPLGVALTTATRVGRSRFCRLRALPAASRGRLARRSIRKPSPMTFRLPALALALFATSAAAQDYNRQDIVRGLCQPDGCDEFTILAAERLRTTDEGTLLKTRVKTFHASYGGRKEGGEENGHVYCSRTKPAIMAEQNGKAVAFFLAPFATEESRESVRRNANFHALYFTICHGMEAGKAAVHNLAGVAGSHGYRVALAQSRFVTLNRAEDVMTGAGERPVADARPPADPRPPATMRPPVEARPLADARPPERPAVEAARRPDREPPRQAPPRVVEKDEGLLSAPRRWTNQAFDALDQAGEWVLGQGRR